MPGWGAAENQEVQSDLQLMRQLMRARGIDFPKPVVVLADRLGGMVYGLLRAEVGRGKRKFPPEVCSIPGRGCGRPEAGFGDRGRTAVGAIAAANCPYR